jgi:hypothetical protein
MTQPYFVVTFLPRLRIHSQHTDQKHALSAFRSADPPAAVLLLEGELYVAWRMTVLGAKGLSEDELQNDEVFRQDVCDLWQYGNRRPPVRRFGRRFD